MRGFARQRGCARAGWEGIRPGESGWPAKLVVRPIDGIGRGDRHGDVLKKYTCTIGHLFGLCHSLAGLWLSHHPGPRRKRGSAFGRLEQLCRQGREIFRDRAAVGRLSERTPWGSAPAQAADGSFLGGSPVAPLPGPGAWARQGRSTSAFRIMKHVHFINILYLYD